MRRGGLDDGAARRDQPAEPAARRQLRRARPAPPAQTARSARGRRGPLQVDGRIEAGARASSSSMRASRNSASTHDRITPTLTARRAPRAGRRGRSRSRRWLRGHGAPPRGTAAAAPAVAQVAHVGRPRIAPPLAGSSAVSQASGTARRSPRSRSLRRAAAPAARPRRASARARGSSTWSLDRGERVAAPAPVAVPAGRVVEVERRAVVDQPQAAVPHQQVGVARRCGRRWSRSASNQTMRDGELGVEAVGRRGSKATDAGQEVEPQVQPGAGAGSGHGSPGRARCGPGRGSSSTKTSLRHRQAERAGDLARRPARRPAPAAPWPAPRNFSTYRPSSSASTIAGSEPPSRSGVT